MDSWHRNRHPPDRISRAKTEQWQYHVEISGVFDEKVANQLGGKGWEFVTIYEQGEGQLRAIYKR